MKRFIGLTAWMLGCAVFEIQGAYGERFVTEAARAGIEIWGLRRKCPGILEGKVRLGQYPDLAPVSLRCGVTLELCETRGLPVLLRRYRYRMGLLVGFLLFLISLFVLSLFVWKIEVPGVSAARAEEIEAVLAENGFEVGTFAPSVNFRQLKYAVMLAFDDISFVSVNLSGSRAVVEVVLADPAPEHVPADVPCNIYASSEGQIISIETLEGVPYVKAGDAVVEGQLLVGGIIDSKIMGYRLVHAMASVRARTFRTLSVTVPYRQTETVDTGRSRSYYSLVLFGHRFDLTLRPEPEYEQYRTEVSESTLYIGDNLVLPFSLIRTEQTEQTEIVYRYTEEQAREEALRQLKERERIWLPGREIEDKRENCVSDGECVRYAYFYTTIEQIAVSREIYSGKDDK